MTISKNLITNTVEGVATDEAGNKKVVAQSAGQKSATTKLKEVAEPQQTSTAKTAEAKKAPKKK